MLLTALELERSSLPLPEVQKFFEANPPPPVDWNDVTSLRAVMDAVERMANSALPPAFDVQEASLQIPMRDGYVNVAKVRKSASLDAQPGPLIVLAFGGGWCGGSNEQLSREARTLVRLFGAVVVNISYRLAPEYKFPVSIQDAWDNLVWLADHALEIGADATKGFIMGGASAGATQTAMCARKAQVEPLAHPLTGQWLYAPMILRKDQVPQRWQHLYLSYEHNKEAPVLPVIALDGMQRLTSWDMMSPWRLPLNLEHSLTGLPKTYTQASGMDPLRDDALLYDEMLKEAGVPTRCSLYQGAPHTHSAFLSDTEVTKRALLDMVNGFGWMLDQPMTQETALGALNFAEQK